MPENYQTTIEESFKRIVRVSAGALDHQLCDITQLAVVYLHKATDAAVMGVRLDIALANVPDYAVQIIDKGVVNVDGELVREVIVQPQKVPAGTSLEGHPTANGSDGGAGGVEKETS